MSEKLKPNFTPVPNVILDEIMRKLALGATKVLFGICRYTFGWGKPEGDRISLKQLQEITGMARGSVARSLKELLARKLIIVQPGDPSHQLASLYLINVEISDDDLVSLRDQSLVSKGDQASLLASLSGETFQRKSKERDNAARKKRAQPKPQNRDSRVKEFIDWFCHEYQSRHGRPYKVWGKHGSLIKQLLATFDLPTLKRCAVALFDSDDDFLCRTDKGIGLLANQINKLAGMIEPPEPAAEPRAPKPDPLDYGETHA